MFANGPERFVEGTDELFGLADVEPCQFMQIRSPNKGTVASASDDERTCLHHVPCGLDGLP
jgi:hypothetical protein